MKILNLRSALILLALSSVLTASAQTSFYGGDFDGNSAFASERNATVTDSRIYDDFTLGGGARVTGLFGNFFLSSDAVITGLHYEVRQGITMGNGGTLLASGNVPVTLTDTGTNAFGMELFNIKSAPVNFLLGGGNYFLSLAAIGTTGLADLATTSGANGVGGPLGNGNSFIDSTSFGYNFDATNDAFFGSTYDFSEGFTAQPAPEPATMAAFALGTLALVRRRRRS